MEFRKYLEIDDSFSSSTLCPTLQAGVTSEALCEQCRLVYEKEKYSSNETYRIVDKYTNNTVVEIIHNNCVYDTYRIFIGYKKDKDYPDLLFKTIDDVIAFLNTAKR